MLSISGICVVMQKSLRVERFQRRSLCFVLGGREESTFAFGCVFDSSCQGHETRRFSTEDQQSAVQTAIVLVHLVFGTIAGVLTVQLQPSTRTVCSKHLPVTSGI